MIIVVNESVFFIRFLFLCFDVSGVGVRVSGEKFRSAADDAKKAGMNETGFEEPGKANFAGCLSPRNMQSKSCG